MKVISYGTKSRYEKCVYRLIDSCETLGVDYTVDLFDDFGGNKVHRLYKPTYILNKIRELKCPVMWIDIDSLLQAKPKIGEFDFDFGYLLAFKMNSRWFADSCHFHNYTKEQISFLKHWKRLCAEDKVGSSGKCHPKVIRAYADMNNKIKTKDCSSWMRGCYTRNFGKRKEIKY
jgi:hypothetical protein